MTAAELQAWRKALGLSQKSAAQLLGISLRQYNRYETGRTQISVPVQKLIENLRLFKMPVTSGNSITNDEIEM